MKRLEGATFCSESVGVTRPVHAARCAPRAEGGEEGLQVEDECERLVDGLLLVRCKPTCELL